jgi:hypothetical protein
VALRLYLTNGAAPYVPATIRGTWSDKALTGASGMLRRKTGASATAAKAETSNSSSWSVLLRRFVSETVNNAGTLQGDFALTLGTLESNDDANMTLQMHMYVIAGDSDTVRGALTSLALGGGPEWPAVGFGRGAAGVQATGTLTNVNVEPGDRIVLEVGYRAANTTTSSRTGTLYYGGTASDLSPNDRNVTTRPGWIDFAHIAVHDAFAMPFRQGDTTTTVGVQSDIPDSGLLGSAIITTTPGPTCTALQGYKVAKTVINGVRPPGRPPGHPPEPEEGMFTYGERFQDGGTLEVRPSLSDKQSTAVRVASTTAESVHTMHPKIVPYALIQGDHELSPPDVDMLTAPPPPKPPSPVRFIAQDVRTRRWLNWELPLVDVEITWTLSGPTLLKARLKPESPTLRELGISAWSTWIHIEQGGNLLGTVLWQPTKIDGEEYSVEATGFSAYAQGMPFFGEDQFYEVDPADVIRRIWAHLQSYPDAQLGVSLSNAMSGMQLGIPALQQVDEDGNPKFDDGEEVKAPDPNSGIENQEDLKITHYTQDPETGNLTVWYNDGAIYVFHPIFDDPKPYVISWYSDTDCGQEMDNLCRTAKIEYREVTWWETEGDVSIIPKSRRLIDLTYPRLGRKRFELRCAQDENMLAAIPLEEATGDKGYASQIMLRGVGEGRDAIRGYAGQADPHRVRRVATVVDQTITTLQGANAGAQDEMLRRRAAITVGQVILKDWHPNMPIGSFMVGDEILITGFVPWAGYIEFWHRIIAYTWKPAQNTMTLDVRRSEQFGYGKPLPVPPPEPRYPWVDQPDFIQPILDYPGDGLTPLPGVPPQ